MQECRQYFLNQLSALLRDCKLLSNAAIDAVIRGVGKHFDTILVSKRYGSFEEEVKGLTSSRISLIDDDDLELGIRLDNLSTQLAETTSVSLWKTHLRFITLLARPDLPKTHNPIGPQGITQGLLTLFKAAGVSSLEEKLMLLDRIELVLRDGLPTIYTQIDMLLERAGVEASQPIIITPPENRRASAAEGMHQPAPGGSKPMPDAVAGSNIPGSFPKAATTLLSQAALDNLLFRLEQMERTQRNNTDFLTASSPKLEALIPELFSDAPASGPAALQPLRASELGVAENTVEGQAIEAVGRLCQSLFSDPELPDLVKNLIGELQVSMIKLALKDRSLLVRANHPCRLLINRLGLAGLGLPADISRQHPVYQRLAGIISHLRSGFSGDASAFANAAEEVEQLRQNHQRAIVEQAAEYVPLLYQLDRRDQATQDIERMIGALDMDDTPEPFQHFIRRDWKRLLEKVWFEQGPESQAWQEHANILSTLLWTFQPKADGEQRKALARQLPAVLKAIKRGMEELGMANEAQTSILDICFALQTKALRPPGSENECVAIVPTIPAEDTNKSGGQPTSGRIEAGTRILHTLDFTSVTKAGGHGTGHAVGEWLELSLDGIRQPLCLCYRSPASGRYLFFNPELALAVSVHPQYLDAQLRDGEARVLGQPGLFERALDRIQASASR